jgi:hypothetical protein
MYRVNFLRYIKKLTIKIEVGRSEYIIYILIPVLCIDFFVDGHKLASDILHTFIIHNLQNLQ